MSYLARRLLMVTTTPWTGILDRLATAAAGAWSLRRLRGGYAGPCVNVRRDSDNATQDISFTASGDLNVTALLAFVGNGNGYVTAWYDQTPGASHLVQGTAASQPQIVSAGALVKMLTFASRPGASTNGGTPNGPNPTNGQDMATAQPAASLTFAQPFTRSSVISFPVAPAGATPNPVLLNSNSDPVALYDTGPGQLSMSVNGGFTAISGITAGSAGVLLELFNQAASSCVSNSVTRTGSVGTGGTGSDFLGIGGHGWVSGERNFEAIYGEMIVFAQPLPASDRQALTTDQCGYWQTPSPYRSVVLADGPYAYWPLNEAGGTVAADISGNSRDGTYQAGAQPASGLMLPGMDGAYVRLNGASDSYIDVSAANQFCAGSAWSIECWAQVAGYNSLPVGGFTGDKGCRFIGNVLYTTSGGWQPGIEWGIQSYDGVNPGTYKYYDSRYSYTPSVTPPQAGVLQHVVITHAPDSTSVYLNGKPVVPAANASASAAIQPILQIGSQGGSMGAMNGTIGEVAVYNSALSAQQVAAHYAAGIASRAGLLDSLTTPVVGVWSLRRLRGGYAGPCVNVRRDSDSATQDIGFTATGDLDIAALLAFTGAANGFVTAWYDQTTNPSDMVQSLPTRQPLIVANGVLNPASAGSAMAGILASAGATSIQELRASAGKLTLDPPFSRACVTGIPAGATSTSFTVLTGSTDNPVIALNAVNLRYQMDGPTTGLTAGNAVTAGAINSVTENYSATASSLSVNGTATNGSIGSSGDGTDLVAAGVLTRIAGASATFCEIIQFGALLASADQAALYASQKHYWGTP
ncbi:arabinofuranosidase catalytic domain-containing protein [Paraburkholderia caffeinilytica]|uniref:arabinofuranosidase catalytic domain-containing protein n=1 Tax=Paraburkholderia caffeinilytica TaxID=1761016 RepID=UPI003DA02EC5